jgi:hypothetical protein
LRTASRTFLISRIQNRWRFGILENKQEDILNPGRQNRRRFGYLDNRQCAILKPEIQNRKGVGLEILRTDWKTI